MFLRSILILLFLLVQLRAAEYFLSPSGDDGDSGGLAAPWKTLSHAVSLLSPGDTLSLRGGTYSERLILANKLATSANPITIQAYQSESAIIDGSTLTVPAGGRAGLVEIVDCNFVTIRGIEVRNYRTASASLVPVGIQIEGAGSGVKISNCKVHHIHQNSTTKDGNGFGISVYGTSATPLDGLVLEGNEVYELRTGQSESVVINGNVTNFLVSKNQVHHCNNIGIDFIGYEGSAPAAVDRARDGICRENYVHDIDSAFNPGYGGDFTSGGGDQSAAGIYVDGGTNITITRNRVTTCNFGIELASEDANGFTDYILLTNNLLHHNFGPGIIMGGYDAQRGKTRFCQVRNNTLFRNDTRESWSGQIALQFYLENNTFKNNILWANPTTKQMIVYFLEVGTAAQRAFPDGNVFDYNLYFCEGDAAEIEFGLNLTGGEDGGNNKGNESFYGVAAWRTAVGGDANSTFHNPDFVTPVPTIISDSTAYHLSENSYSVDRGEPSPPFAAGPDEKDFEGESRIANFRVDLGCDEFLTNLQSWRDLHFNLPDGGPGAGDLDDFDQDSIANLVEYSQGMNPTLSDERLAPGGKITGSVFRYQYRKDASELDYRVMASRDLLNWNQPVPMEVEGEAGSYSIDFSTSSPRLFVRFGVSLRE